MRERYVGRYAADLDPATHPAALAWASLGQGEASLPSAVTPLKPQVKASHKSGVYRLHGAGPDGQDVVAKRCRRKSAAVELEVYRRVLPDLPLAQLQLLASLDEGEAVGFVWMFLEDGGDVLCEPEDVRSVARWLAYLHVGAARLMGGRPLALPDRGLGYYRQHAEHARSRLSAAASDASPPAREVLVEHLHLLDRIEGHWQTLTDRAALMPQTLAHGDFVRKNLRARRAGGGTHVYVLDWETAGRGSPAADLASLSTMFPGVEPASVVAEYAGAIREHWRGVDRDTIELTRRAGIVLRLLAAADWASHGLGYGCDERALRKLSADAPRLRAAVEELESHANDGGRE